MWTRRSISVYLVPGSLPLLGWRCVGRGSRKHCGRARTSQRRGRRSGLGSSQRAALHRQALVAAAALLTLAKFSYGVDILLVIVAVALKIALQERRIPWILPIYLLEVLAFWLLAGQRLADIPAFFGNSLEIGMGYSAMQLPSPAWNIACFAVTAAIVIAAIAKERWHAERWYALFAVLPSPLFSWAWPKARLSATIGLTT